MELEIIEVHNINITKEDLIFEYNNTSIKVKRSHLKNCARVPINNEYVLLLEQIGSELQLSSKETIMFLIDMYEVKNYNSIKTVRNKILYRLYKGVDSNFLIQLRLLYTSLGHFLKRVRYI